MESFTVRLHYSEPILRRAVRTFVIRRMMRSWILIATGAVLIAGVLLVLEGNAALELGFILASLVFMMAFVFAVWRAHSLNTLGRYRAMDPPEAELIATDTDSTFRSSLGSSTIPWRGFTELWELPDCWMLFLAPSQFLTLPLADLSPEMRAFLRARLPI